MTVVTCACGAQFTVAATGPAAQASAAAQLAQHRRAACPLAGKETK